MTLPTDTKIRLLTLSLLLAVTGVEATVSGQAKNATGCSLVDPDSRPTRGSCMPHGSGCYECLYSDPYGITQCWESPDGLDISCQPFTY